MNRFPLELDPVGKLLLIQLVYEKLGEKHKTSCAKRLTGALKFSSWKPDTTFTKIVEPIFSFELDVKNPANGFNEPNKHLHERRLVENV